MLPDRSILIGQKLVENAKIQIIEMRHFEKFSNNVDSAESADEPRWPYSSLYRHRSYQARREKAKQRIKIPFSQLFLSLWLARGAREKHRAAEW